MLEVRRETFVTARYALYLSPAPDSAWGRFGSAWLGRCADGSAVEPLVSPMPDHALLRRWTAAPRRYGFHATLKAPFRLASGRTVEELTRAVERQCTGLAAFRVPALGVTLMNGFLALVPDAPDVRLSRLAATCVQELDAFRAPPDAAETARRLRLPLDARGLELLERWGYPHVLERFRPHFTLTDDLSADPVTAGWLTHVAASEIAARAPGSLPVDAIAIVEEPDEGADFRVLRRVRFGHRGRLVYVVGPSGAGKDAVLAWARERLGDGPAVRFAQRIITRPPSASGERHRSVTPAEFEELQRAGSFAMTWRANGCWYGVSRTIQDWLAAGLTVVVNGSRSHLPRAQERFPQLEVIHLTAPSSLLRARLLQRGRESETEVAARLERNATWSSPADVPVMEIPNDAELADAGETLARFLTA